MAASILPFSLAKSNEKSVDRGAIALVDEFADAVGLPEKVEKEFPAPGSNAGIAPSVYVRTLMYHFSEGGRHIEEARQIKADEGFRALIDLGRMPGLWRSATGFARWALETGRRRFGAAMTGWFVGTCSTAGRSRVRSRKQGMEN
jgi:hypothetical protein